jgi:hypothetical protein
VEGDVIVVKSATWEERRIWNTWRSPLPYLFHRWNVWSERDPEPDVWVGAIGWCNGFWLRSSAQRYAKECQMDEREASSEVFDRIAPNYDGDQPEQIISTAKHNPGIPVMFDAAEGGRAGVLCGPTGEWKILVPEKKR